MAYAGHRRLSRDVADALWIIVSRMDVAERRWRVEQLKTEGAGGS